MIIFDTVINFIESLLFVWFIAEFFDFKDNKNKFIIISTLVEFIILEVSQFINYFGVLLSIFCIIGMLLLIYLFLKTLTFEHIYIVLLQDALISLYVVVCAYIAAILPFYDTHIIECIICKVLQLIGNIILLRYKDKFALTLEISKWKIVIVFEIILLILLYSMFYTVIFIGATNAINFNLLLVFILCIMFMYIVNLINEEHREKMQLIKAINQR